MVYYFNDSNLDYLTYNPSTLEMIVYFASGNFVKLLYVLDKHYNELTESDNPYDYFNNVLLEDNSIGRG